MQWNPWLSNDADVMDVPLVTCCVNTLAGLNAEMSCAVMASFLVSAVEDEEGPATAAEADTDVDVDILSKYHDDDEDRV